jgi:hypothetical protein
MIGTSKRISSTNFLIFTTFYIMLSLAALLLTSGGYRLLFFLIVMGSFYLIAWLFVVITCLIGKQVRYTPILIYPILFIQTIITLFNFSDTGYYGISCRTKNFIQQFLDFTECGQLWIGAEMYSWMLIIYVAVVIIFAIDILRLRSLHPKDSE